MRAIKLIYLFIGTCCLSLTASVASAEDNNLRPAKRALQDARMADLAAKAEFSDVFDLFENFDFGDLLECAGNWPGCLLQLTLFAPNNDALFGFDDKMLLLKYTTDADFRPHLLGLLKYHVAFGEVRSGEIKDGGEIKTFLGESVETSVKSGGVFINTAKVVTPDKDAPFGVIHVINEVLQPNFVKNDIVETLNDDDDFSILRDLIVAAGLDNDLRADGPLTVFAPTNAAFEKLGQDNLDDLAKVENKKKLADILLYHVSASTQTLWDLRMRKEVETLLGGSTIEVGRNGFFGVELNNGVGIEKSDILARNGVIHAIDAVLIPPSRMELPSIVEVASSDPDNFSTLVAALTKSPEVLATLQGDGPFTVFAPTNAAFAELGEGILDSESGESLAKILSYHVVAGELKQDDLAKGKITALNTFDITVDVRKFFGFFLGATLNDDAKIVAFDIEASNGVIHVIDKVLIPPDAPTKSIAEIASGTEELATLVEALKAADIVDPLADSNGGPYTVFAPTNAAFDALGDILTDLVTKETAKLKDILLYHVVKGKVERDDLVDGKLETLLTDKDIMVNDKAFFFNFFNLGVELNGVADVVAFDIEASNGVIHLIDAVLIPPESAGG